MLSLMYIVFTGLICGLFHGTLQIAPSTVTDEVLVKRVREAAKKNIEFGLIEKFVGKKAPINTVRLEDRAVFEIVDVVIDAKESEINSLRDFKELVYWVRPVQSNNPQIFGVVRTLENEWKVFVAVVRPPS